MRKRLLSFLLIFALMLASAAMLSGCSGSDEKDKAKTETSEEVKDNSKDESSEEASEASEGTEDAQAESESVSDSGSSDKSSAKSDSKATKSKTSNSKNKNSSSSSNKKGTSSGNTSSGGSGSTGSSGSSGDSGGEAEGSYVTLSVDGAFAGRRIELSSGDSVYDVLKKSGVSIGADSSSMGVYVYSINGLKEGDKGPRSGWTYKVNGTMPPKSANAYFPKAGDSIRWVFVS